MPAGTLNVPTVCTEIRGSNTPLSKSSLSIGHVVTVGVVVVVVVLAGRGDVVGVVVEVVVVLDSKQAPLMLGFCCLQSFTKPWQAFRCVA